MVGGIPSASVGTEGVQYDPRSAIPNLDITAIRAVDMVILVKFEENRRIGIPIERRRDQLFAQQRVGIVTSSIAVDECELRSIQRIPIVAVRGPKPCIHGAAAIDDGPCSGNSGIKRFVYNSLRK